MRTLHFALLMGSTVLVSGGCKKGSGGTGGGGAWLVGENGLMANIRADGSMGADYDLGTDDDLDAITCRGAQTAFVVGQGGTFLRTFDGGETWESVDLGTTRALTDVASGAGVVYVAGDSVFSQSFDDGDTWDALPGTGTAVWRSVATGHDGAAAVLVRADGSIWRWDGSAIRELATLPGARAISMSPDGAPAVVVGDGGGMLRSDDAGLSWARVDTGIDADLHAAWATGEGAIVAVGAGGAVVRVDGDVEVSWPGAATLRAVHVDASGAAIAAGEGGEVLLSDDGGATWDRTDLPLEGTVLGLDSVAGEGHR